MKSIAFNGSPAGGTAPADECGGHFYAALLSVAEYVHFLGM